MPVEIIGRQAVHLISGGSDTDQARDGDHVNHVGRYRRTEEYAQILKQAWTDPGSFDFSGEFYQIEKACSDIRCAQVPRIPMYRGGGSDAAIACLAPYIDVFMLWGEPLADTEAFMGGVVTAAGSNDIGFSVSTRPIPGRTEGEAWDRAREIHREIKRRTGNRGIPGPENVGSQRLLNAIAEPMGSSWQPGSDLRGPR